MKKEEIGKTIRERRAYLGIDQLTLSLLAGVGINTLVAIERGQGNPTIDSILKVTDALGLVIDMKLK